jgi:hypothetical protein
MGQERDLDGFVRSDRAAEHGVDLAADVLVGRAALQPDDPRAAGSHLRDLSNGSEAVAIL